MIELDEAEWAARRLRYQQMRSTMTDLDEQMATVADRRAEGMPEFREILDTFIRSGDAAELRFGMDSWSKRHRTFGFGGTNGQMLLNQLVNDDRDSFASSRLRQLIQRPDDDTGAEAAFEELVDHITVLREGGSGAAVGRVPAFLSWWWWMQDHETWPVAFSSAASILAQLGFLDPGAEPWERYAAFRAHVRQFGPWREVERVLREVNTPDLGIDPSAVTRCADVANRGAHPGEPGYEVNRAAVSVLRAMAKELGGRLGPTATDVLGVAVKPTTPSEFWNGDIKRVREDIWISWRPQGEAPQPFLQLVIDAEGMKLGLFPSFQQEGGKGYPDRVRDALDAVGLEHLRWVPWGATYGDPSSGRMYSLFGTTLELEDLLTAEGLQRTFSETVSSLLPAFEAVWARTSPVSTPPPEPATDPRRQDLRVAFIAQTGYPTERDRNMRKAREEFAALLQPAQLPSLSPEAFRRVVGGAYGSPGNQSTLMAALRDGGEEVWDRLLHTIEYLLWDDVDDIATRINHVLEGDHVGVRGFKEAVTMKLLAIAYPDRFLPVFPFTGDNGKAALLRAMGEVPPTMGVDAGTRQLEANDRLRELTEPLFPGDPWAQMMFLYWVKEQEDRTGAEIDEVASVEVDRIGDAAATLSMPREFLEEVHQLLSDHRQVILYGPPGTGKTYVAQHLVEALAPDEEQRMLIQFHPSSSYEDFFEGYRPAPGEGGGISYHLVDGPLRVMAERARTDARRRPHVLIIDEINRANLAKVLGELLFLLEYRDREIRPMYRPDEPFSLPENLWILGTMNTADRSIATVDAALRRRFHFVPFVPDDREDNPIAGVLRRWLDNNDEPGWVAELVDGVNQQLRKELGGDHLLLGPSYFMRGGLDREALSMIWRYRIEPLVDDLFFGSAKAKEFRFDVVWSRYGPDATEEE